MEKRKLRLALAIALSILLLAAVFGMSANHSYKSILSAETRRTEESLARSAAEGKQQLSSFLELLSAKGEAAATLVSVTGADSELLYRCFDQTERSSAADSVLFFGSEGRLKYGAIDDSQLFAPCAMDAMRSGTPAYSPALLCSDGAERFAVSVPCQGAAGAVTMLYPAALLKQALSSPAGTELYLLKQDASPVFSESEPLPWQLPRTFDVPALSAMSEKAALCHGEDGDCLVFATSAGIGSVYIVSSAPMSAVYKNARESFLHSCSFIILAFLVLAVLLVACLIFLSARRKQLRLERQRFCFAANSANRVVFEYRRDKDRLTFISTSESISLPAGDKTVALYSFLSLLKPEDHDEATNAIRILHEEGCTQLTVRMSGLRAAGEYRWYHITAEELSPCSSTVIGTIEDIDEREREHLDLVHKAVTDPLTGLYNRAETERLINERLVALQPGHYGTFCIVDMDNFKHINDTKGHDCGDRALSFFAARLRATFRLGDIIGRLGGDEFIIYMERTADRDVVQRRFDELMDSLSVRESAQELALPELACSIGCVAAQAGDDFGIVYNLADKALYRAKTTGKRKAEFEVTA